MRGLHRLVAAADRLSTFETITAGVADPAHAAIASPFSSSSDLKRIAWRDVFGDADLTPVGRRAAMRIPALARARNLVVSALARVPLVQMDAGNVSPVQPAWTSSVPTTSPQLRMAWTVDDLMFYGLSCWQRMGDGSPGPRIRFGDWRFDDDGRVVWNDTPMHDDEVITFFGFTEGILDHGREAITDARMLYEAVRKRLRNPVPSINLHQTGGDQMTPDEIDELIDRWAVARRGDNGGVSYTNEVIDAQEMGTGGEQLMIDARNAAAVDMARIANVSAGMVDATAPKASLNYETQEGRSLEFHDLDLSLYAEPITARLSLDDVTPPGSRIAFDFTTDTQPAYTPTGAPAAD